MRVIADDGAVLALRIDGPNDAPALVLLHSIGCDSSMWDAEANALKQQFRVIRLDTRGHGSSSVPSGDYTLERLGRDVLVALDMVGVAQAHVCGLSMGGMVAQWLAVHTPARVDRLILADTAARIGTPESWQARRETVRAQGMAAIAEMAIGRFFSEEFRARAPDTVARFRRLLETTSPEGYAGCCAALRDADFSCELARIVAPTLVICGRLDISTPPSQAEALVQDIPEAELLLLDAAHLSNIERPVAFLEGMHRHLGS